jgi:hypothetical protein
MNLPLKNGLKYTPVMDWRQPSGSNNLNQRPKIIR